MAQALLEFVGEGFELAFLRGAYGDFFLLAEYEVDDAGFGHVVDKGVDSGRDEGVAGGAYGGAVDIDEVKGVAGEDFGLMGRAAGAVAGRVIGCPFYSGAEFGLEAGEVDVADVGHSVVFLIVEAYAA